MEAVAEDNRLTEKERLLAVLSKQPVDRPPVIIPGGMMNAAVGDAVKAAGLAAPAVHLDAEKMASLALAVREHTGLENIGVPFCMTAEAEALGSRINYGNELIEPRVVHDAISGSKEIGSLPPFSLSSCRLPVILEALSIIKQRTTGVPIIGNLTGPVSLATSIMDAMVWLRMVRRQPDQAHDVLEIATTALVAFGQAMVDHGADVIVIADPTASGEILGPAVFTEFAFEYLQRIIGAVRARGAKVIVHICGDVNPILTQLIELGADAISVDAMVNLAKLKQEKPANIYMGNVSTFLLVNGPVSKIAASAANKLENGVDILAPACGLSTKTPIENIRALAQTAKAYPRGKVGVNERF